MRIWLMSTFAAIFVQPLVFAVRLAPDLIASGSPVHGLAFAFLSVLAVATIAVVALGVPVFALLRKLGRINWRTISAAGFLLGSLPVALFWPSSLDSFSSGQNWHGKYVDVYINGSPTIYAWLIHAEGTLCFGLHGLAGALAFYAVWRALDGPQHV